MAQLNKSQRAMLEAVETKLQALITRRSPCAVPYEAKEAIRLYVESWVLPNLREVLEADQKDRALNTTMVGYAKQVPKQKDWENAWGPTILDQCARTSFNG